MDDVRDRDKGAGEATPRPGKRVSLHTVERLSIYRRLLEELDREGVVYVHSRQLAELAGVTPAQLRRDLASFGTFGSVSRGYSVSGMVRVISRVLGTDAVQRVVLIGVGDLGRALLSYGGFEERGFHIVAAVDVDRAKIGRVFAGRRCRAVSELEEVVAESGVTIAMIASRREGLQELVDRVAAAGVRGVINFVPTHVRPPDGCVVENIDISAKLEKLSFRLMSYGRAALRPPGDP